MMPPSLTVAMARSRRARFRWSLLLAAALIAACGGDPAGPQPPDAETIAKLTITARPSVPTETPRYGLTRLGLATGRDGFLYVPSTYAPDSPAPLLVLLHPAGSSADFWDSPSIRAFADGEGFVILAIDSRYETWDLMVTGGYDVDVAFLDDALELTFAQVNIDPARVSIGGFSDGASEALGVGIANAGLFLRIVAFSPGQLYLPFGRGMPEILVTHGLHDLVTTYANTRDFIVQRLRNLGMTVLFIGFEGAHSIPEDMERAAMQWLTDQPITG